MRSIFLTLSIDHVCASRYISCFYVYKANDFSSTYCHVCMRAKSRLPCLFLITHSVKIIISKFHISGEVLSVSHICRDMTVFSRFFGNAITEIIKC